MSSHLKAELQRQGAMERNGQCQVTRRQSYNDRGRGRETGNVNTQDGRVTTTGGEGEKRAMSSH